MFPLQFATRRFSCFLQKHKIFRKKTNHYFNHLTRHIRLKYKKIKGNIDFFSKNVFFTLFSFAKEILENMFVLHVTGILKRGNVTLYFFVSSFGVILASATDFPRGGNELPGGVENFHVGSFQDHSWLILGPVGDHS